MSGLKPVHRAVHGPPMYALSEYAGSARKAVIAYKERGRRELASWFGALVTEALPMLPEADLVPVPSRPSAVRKRGYDHMALVAGYADATVLPLLRLDRRARDSVGLDAGARAENLRGRLSCEPTGASVILVDDVITTGATAAACSSALSQAGARVIAVLALTAT